MESIILACHPRDAAGFGDGDATGFGDGDATGSGTIFGDGFGFGFDFAYPIRGEEDEGSGYGDGSGSAISVPCNEPCPMCIHCTCIDDGKGMCQSCKDCGCRQ